MKNIKGLTTLVRTIVIFIVLYLLCSVLEDSLDTSNWVQTTKSNLVGWTIALPLLWRFFEILSDEDY